MSKEKAPTGDADSSEAPRVRRIALRVAYDGGGYVGWQRQGPENKGRTVQETIERALADLLREPVTLHAAGRTDTGVHARGQCAHFDVPLTEEDGEERRPGVSMPIEAFVPALAQRLPRDISVWRATEVSTEFHARYSATQRRYRYLLVWADKHSPPSCLARHGVGHLRGRHDFDAMHEAAAAIEGEHDFSRLRSVLCQAENPVRSIDVARLESLTNGDVGDEVAARLGLFPGYRAAEFTIAARAFLMHQVRLLVGGISLVGRGRMSLEEWRSVLDGAEPSTNIAPAPPSGLTLDWVEYPNSPDA